MIKGIAFDLGNVVLTSDYPYNTPDELKEFCTVFGCTMDNLDLAFTIAFPPYAHGQLSEDEFWEKFLYTARAKKKDIPLAKEIYRRNQKENEHVLSLVKKLNTKYQVSALSTIPKEWLTFKKEKFLLDKYFKIIISSGHEGISKPHVAIYNRLIKEVHLAPSELVFIDDKETLLLPAKNLGMQTIVFRGQTDLEKQLRALHISF